MRALFARPTQPFNDELLPPDRWTPSSVATPPAPDSASSFLLEQGTRAVCAALGCEHQLRFWKRSARPIFEGQWASSRACATRLINASIRKQILGVSSSTGDTGSHRHRIPLGLVLLDRGIVTQTQLRIALDAQKSAGRGRIGYWLEETCGIAPAKITVAIAAQWNRPVLSDTGFEPERMALVLPATLRKELHLLPLRVAAGKILYAAFVDEVDVAAVHALERMTGLQIETGLLPHNQFAAAESRLDFIRAIEFHEESVSDVTELTERVVDTLFRQQPVASRLVSVRSGWWLRMWLERSACSGVGTLPSSGEDVVDVLFRR